MLLYQDYRQLLLPDDPMAPQGMELPPVIETPMKGDFGAVVLRVVDGDTVDVSFLVGRERLRINGIDAPEKYTAEGKRAAEYAEALLPVGRVHLVRLTGKGKFGRRLADLELIQGGWFSDDMLRTGRATPYHGGKRG